MNYILFVSLFIVLVSCSNQSPIKSKNGVNFADEVKFELNNLSESEWEVGKDREQTVSKGINLKVDVPQIEEEGVQFLQAKYGIDTWVYRVTKITRGSKRIIGFFQYNLRNISNVNDYVNVNIYYHAASVSSEFRRFSCPAFNHRFRLASFGFVESNERQRNQIYVRRKEILNANISEVSFAPMIFSVGKSMVATYKIDVAFYNSSEKRLYSSWFPAKQYITVKSEAQIQVPTCRGIKEETNPLPGSRAPRLEDLRIPQ